MIWAHPLSTCFLTFTSVSVKQDSAFLASSSSHRYQTELQSLPGWCTYRIEPWWQILRRQPGAKPQTECIRPTWKELELQQERNNSTGYSHVYFVCTLSGYVCALELEGHGNVEGYCRRSTMASFTGMPECKDTIFLTALECRNPRPWEDGRKFLKTAKS